MPIREKIEDWKKFPNALGSEADAAVIVGEVANALGEVIPAEVSAALKKLALRGTMRDIAAAIQRGKAHKLGVPTFHDLVDAGAAASGLSWTEAIARRVRHDRGLSQELADPPDVVTGVLFVHNPGPEQVLAEGRQQKLGRSVVHGMSLNHRNLLSVNSKHFNVQDAYYKQNRSRMGPRRQF